MLRARDLETFCGTSAGQERAANRLSDVESHIDFEGRAWEQWNTRGQRLLRIPDPVPRAGSPKWRMGIFELMVRD